MKENVKLKEASKPRRILSSEGGVHECEEGNSSCAPAFV